MQERFSQILQTPPFDEMGGVFALAVGVSGGPDSMALAHMLCKWSDDNNGPEIHLLSVDHGLRPKSSDEAKSIAQMVDSWPHARHAILKWEGDKPQSRIQEAARDARYRLFRGYCDTQNIKHLFLAHHGDDQVETLLFRLAKGSGLDGLCAMRPWQEWDGGFICRPLLDYSKADLVEYCEAHDIPYLHDPSNDKDDFARVRLRKLIAGLEEEGFSLKRAAITTQRLNRARDALENIAEGCFENCKKNVNTKRLVFNSKSLLENDYEIILRVIKKALFHLSEGEGYGPRTEKLESLVQDLISKEGFTKRTLGGVVFEISADGSELILEKEHF